MQTLSTTRMSSKGQVVIPEGIRSRLGLAPGAQFIVVGEEDVVVLKVIVPPVVRDFNALLRRARRQAKAAGLKRSDIARAVARARGRK